MTDLDQFTDLDQLIDVLRLLRKARQYIADAGSDEDLETQRNSAALLAEIDSILNLSD